MFGLFLLLDIKGLGQHPS